MFSPNFIAEPGIQKETSDESWSYLQKKVESAAEESPAQPKEKIQNTKAKWAIYTWAAGIIIIIVSAGIFMNPEHKVSPDMVLNQVVDLIIESGYMKELQLAEAHFNSDYVQVTITAGELSVLQNFTLGYRKEDNIPYEIFRKDEINYVSLNFPWEGNKKGGSLETLKALATKTVFSNKISIKFTKDNFELRGRPTDIISYLLQMADNGLIQKYTLSIYHLESGQFYLKVQSNQI
ncbi:hypothetical protein HX837_02990 [Marine Group I thaumarchaeote]|uniref:Uncharacterized protein n=1 Tax=Marine Group I thaumarchaeote TaxID=2511932 RepID=A0A7K4MNK6_9ARCH|nr:hypothetical protein [Marine Group I thaumarchaeote]